MSHTKSINDIFEEVAAKENHLIRVLVVWQSPISGLEHREAYFTEAAEAALWKDQMDGFYKKLGYDYHIYMSNINR